MKAKPDWHGRSEVKAIQNQESRIQNPEEEQEEEEEEEEEVGTARSGGGGFFCIGIFGCEAAPDGGEDAADEAVGDA